MGTVKVVLDYSPEKRIPPHYGLSGRATNLCSAFIEVLGLAEDLVAKLYWGEESRTSEAEILKEVYRIADEEPDVKGHVPEMVVACKFCDSSTSAIRKRLNLPTDGARVLYLAVFKKLKPITTLYGNEFLASWWQTVKCHLALWKHGVYHRDVSASNLMWRSGKEGAVGVLNDFDLATLKGSTRGNERTGTVPFMAVQLLSEDGLAGKINHAYEHDLESFLWVLMWICLRYNKGTLRDTGDRPLDDWVNVDALTCRGKKLNFLSMPPKETPGEGYEFVWLFARACMEQLQQHVWPGWSVAPATLSDASNQKEFFEPFDKLINKPFEAVTETHKNIVYLPPPSKPPWGTAPSSL